MATYRKRLKDKDGNTIIPAMAGDQTEWIQTGDIADEAVTSDKIDWTTVYVSADALSSDKSYSANTNTDVQTMTLPAGKRRR